MHLPGSISIYVILKHLIPECLMRYVECIDCELGGFDDQSDVSREPRGRGPTGCRQQSAPLTWVALAQQYVKPLNMD